MPLRIASTQSWVNPYCDLGRQSPNPDTTCKGHGRLSITKKSTLVVLRLRIAKADGKLPFHTIARNVFQLAPSRGIIKDIVGAPNMSFRNARPVNRTYRR